MKVYNTNPDNIDRRAIRQAVEVLRNGGIVIYPTDTLYAMGCDALDSKAVDRLCRIKGLSYDRQLLSVICHDISQAAEYARIDNRAFAILKDALPGPFTFVLPATKSLPKQFKSRKTVGIRIPDNAIARMLVEELGHPLLSSSVRPNDPDDILSPEALAIDFEGEAELLIDGGQGGSEPSTIVDLTDSSNPEILRQGTGTL